MLVLPNLFLLLAFAHMFMGFGFYVKFRAKWFEMMHHPNRQGREYYFRRARRQFFVIPWSLGLLALDLWFLTIFRGTVPTVITIGGLAISVLSFPALYTLGKYRYEWRDLGKHFKTCWQQRKLTWY